jgi:hypothetical protein
MLTHASPPNILWTKIERFLMLGKLHAADREVEPEGIADCKDAVLFANLLPRA